MASCSEQFPKSFMKFCSAVLEEQRIRDWEGQTDGRTDERTNERTNEHKDHYIPPQFRLRGVYKKGTYFIGKNRCIVL